MKYEIHMAAEAAKYELLSSLAEQTQAAIKKALDCEERGDYKGALQQAIVVRSLQRKSDKVAQTDSVRAVAENDEVFSLFFGKVKGYIGAVVEELYKQLFLMALRPWAADKDALDAALASVDLVAADLLQFAERYPALIQEYLAYLRAIPRDVEIVLKEIE